MHQESQNTVSLMQYYRRLHIALKLSPTNIAVLLSPLLNFNIFIDLDISFSNKITPFLFLIASETLKKYDNER